MNQLSELFWSASVEQLKQGYIYEADREEYTCLVCGKSFTQGIIYQKNDVFYDAGKFVQVHVASEHTSMFEYLLSLDKKLTGLTDLQKELVHRFYLGWSDNEIVKEVQGGSTSTIRNHRFTLREKMKQARIFLAIMELAEAKGAQQPKFLEIHRTATMLDERYAITEEENEEILAKYFAEGPDGPLTEFPRKEKRKVAILKHLMKKFDVGKIYSEKEVNAVLQEVFADYVTLRRYLVEYGFLDRLEDGSKYWVKVQ